MKPKYLWWGALALVVVIGGGMAVAVSLCLFCAPPSSIASLQTTPVAAVEVGTQIGQRLPEVQLRSLDDKPVQLAQLAGQPTVLYFSAVWCTSCRAEVKELVHLKGQHQDRLQVVYVDITPQTDTPQALREFAQEFSSPNFVWTLDDLNQPSVIPLKVNALGTMYLLDAQGVIAFRGVSSVGTEQFKQTLAKLAGK